MVDVKDKQGINCISPYICPNTTHQYRYLKLLLNALFNCIHNRTALQNATQDLTESEHAYVKLLQRKITIEKTLRKNLTAPHLILQYY